MSHQYKAVIDWKLSGPSSFIRPGNGAGLVARCWIRAKPPIRAAGLTRAALVATLAGETLYARFGYSVAERYEAPMPGGLTIAMVRMIKSLT